MAASSDVRQRKMVPQISPPPPYSQLAMDNHAADLDRLTQTSRSNSNHVPRKHIEKNGSLPPRWTVDFNHYQETSLSEPLLNRESDTNSENEINTFTETDTTTRDHVTEFIVKEQDEASWQIALQVFLPYLVAGLGMVGAGLVLDNVQVSHSVAIGGSL